MSLFQFNKLKSPLVIGAVLLSVVACSDYDDQIADLSNRIEDIEGEYVSISSMEDQIAAVAADIPDLTSIYSRLDALEGELEGVDLSELSESIAALEGIVESLDTTINTQIESTVTSDFLTKMLDDVYLTEVTLSQIQALVGDENEGLIKDIVDAMASASEWVGNDELSKYLKISDYNEYTDAQATAAATAYFESIKETLIEEVGSDLSEDIQLNSDAVAKLNSALEALTSRIAELEGRIQSLVFVPTHAGDFAVTFAANDYVEINSSKVYLTPVSSSRELTFRVSPASWAEKFNTDNVTLYSEKYTRATAPFSIEKIEASEEEAGRFTVTLKYNLDDAATEGYGIALHVKIDAISEDATAGTDYVTDYVSVDVEAGEDMTNSICYGGYYGDSFRYFAYAGSSSDVVYENLELEYNSTESVEFFAGCDWYIYNGTDYELFASIYSSESLLVVTPPTAAATASANSDKYTLTATSAAIKSGSTDLIGNIITSDYYKFAITSGSESLDFGRARSRVEITALTHDFVTTAWDDLKWEYSNTYNKYVSAGATTVDGCIAVLGDMSAEMFNEMYANNGSGSGRAVVYEADGQTRVAGASAMVEFFSEVNGSNDIKPIKVTLVGMPTVSADYVVIYTDTNVFGDVVNIEIPVSIEGVPSITSLDTINTSFDFEGQGSDMLVDGLAAALWAKNSAALAGHITESEFETIIASARVTTTTGQPMSLGISSDVLSVVYDFGSLQFGEVYTMAISLSDSSLGDDFAEITANVKLENILVGTIQKANAFVDAAGNVEIETTLTDTSFSVVDKDLKSTHNLQSDLAGVVMTYYITEDLAAWAAASDPSLVAPAVNNGVLEWNDWNSTEINMVVEASINGVVVDSAEFVAYITNPLADKIETTVLNLYIDDLAGSVDLNSAISLEVNKGVISANVFPTYQLVFGSTAPLFEVATVATNDPTTETLTQLNGDIVSFSAAAESSAVMKNPVEYYYTVTYKTTYFGEYKADITVVVNEAGVARN